MKRTKIISAILAMATIAASIALPAAAEDDLSQTEMDPVVYTYTDENGNRTEIRQSELDAGHWNKDALGKTAPVVYEDFPVIMNPFVDDYAGMSLEIIYLKSAGEYDDAYVTVTDMYNDEDVYTEDLTNGTVYTDNLDMDSYYRIKITECFDGGDRCEYTRYISTAYEAAEMPEYVTDPTTDDTEDVSIVDTANIELATTVDEYGRESFDADIAAFTNVPANEWSTYINTLDDNKLYKVVAGDGNNIKTGFISTYSWGDGLGIFIPGYTLHSENIMESDGDVYSVNSTNDAFDPSMINNSVVLNSYEYDCYGDELFNNTSSYYKVFKYVIKGFEAQQDVYNVRINASDGFSYLVWYKKSNSSTLVKNYNSSSTNTGNKNISMVAYFDNDYLDVGDTMYFIIYTSNSTGLKGSFCLENADIDDDVTGSAYAQYISGNSINCATYYPHYDEDDILDQYGSTCYLTNTYDMDTFYINNTSDNDSSYVTVFFNEGIIDEDGHQVGSGIYITLYYVDFDEDSHFVLKKQSTKSIRAKNLANGYTGIGNVTFAPRNVYTKYFLEVMASSTSNFQNSEYSLYTMFYPES